MEEDPTTASATEYMTARMPRLPGNRAAEIRQRAGFDRAQDAAEKLACSRNYLLQLEEGHAQASETMIAKLAALYGATTDQIRDALTRQRRDLLARKIAQIDLP